MTEVDERSRYSTVTAAARFFALVVLAAPVAFIGDYGPILNRILLAAVWMAAIFVEGLDRVPVMSALVIEAGLVSFLSALTLVDSNVLVPAQVIPLFIAGLVRGSRGMLEVVGIQLVVLTVFFTASPDVSFGADLAWPLFTWLMVGLGFAMRPDVVVTDLQLPDGTGLDIIRTIRQQSESVGLVMLTMHSGDDQIFAAMEAGASAFVGKDAPRHVRWSAQPSTRRSRPTPSCVPVWPGR